MPFRPGLWGSCGSKHLLQGDIPLESSQPSPFQAPYPLLPPWNSQLAPTPAKYPSLPPSFHPLFHGEETCPRTPFTWERGRREGAEPSLLPRKVMSISNPRTELEPMERGGPDPDLVLSRAQRNEVGRGTRESLSQMAGHQHLSNKVADSVCTGVRGSPVFCD